MRAAIALSLVLAFGTVSGATECQFSDIILGEYKACGKQVVAGTWVCWGDVNTSNTSVPSAISSNTFVKTSADGGHTLCGIKANGGIVCFLDGISGATDSNHIVSEAPSGTGYKDIAVGGPTACAIKSDDTIECWGHEQYDPETGGCSSPPHYGTRCTTTRDTISWASPSTAPSGSFLSISAGRGTVFCGVKTDTTLACWGDSGNESQFFANIPAGSGWDAVRVTAENAYACAHKNSDDSVTCWGSAYTTVNPSTLDGPAATAGAYKEADFIVYPGGACALKTSDSSRVCWGDSWGGVSGGSGKHTLRSENGYTCSLYDQTIGGSYIRANGITCSGRTSPSNLWNNTPTCPYVPAAMISTVIE